MTDANQDSAKRGLNPIVKTLLAVIIVGVVVVLTYVGRTLFVYASNGSSNTPPPPSHYTPLPSSDASGSAVTSSIAYAVADVEGSSQKDRDSVNGQKIAVSGYIVSTSPTGAAIADSPHPSSTDPRLTISPPPAGAKVGDKVRAAGVYDSKSNVLNVGK